MPAEPQPLTAAERELAIAELERVADTLAKLSTWLGSRSEDQAAILIEDAWRDLNAAAHVIERRQRLRPAGWLGNGSYADYGPQRQAAS